MDIELPAVLFFMTIYLMINFTYRGALRIFLDIYSRAKSQKSGEYEYKLVETLSQYYNKTSTTVPIESCDDKWCKIYYPCGDTEYYVKKDEIEQLWPNGQKTWGSK